MNSNSFETSYMSPLHGSDNTGEKVGFAHILRLISNGITLESDFVSVKYRVTELMSTA